MEDFSLFQHAFELAGASVENLGEVQNVSRNDFETRETFLFRAPTPCLEYACLLIENALLLRTHRGGHVYAGFEKLSLMEGVVDRYMRIADVSARVYVFGEPDWVPPRHPNLRVVCLSPSMPLAREWFVIADSPAMRIALVSTLETCPKTSITHKRPRTFRALKTSDPMLVEKLVLAADEAADLYIANSRKVS